MTRLTIDNDVFNNCLEGSIKYVCDQIIFVYWHIQFVYIFMMYLFGQYVICFILIFGFLVSFYMSLETATQWS